MSPGRSGGGRPPVLVVGRSRVTSVVVGCVVERTGLKARIELPEDSAAALAAVRPAIVILDGGPGDGDCDQLIEPLRGLRGGDGRALPAVILLSTSAAAAGGRPIAQVADMILSKPITVDRLQPAIEALRARNGDFSG